jgi:hypothetical protein
VAVFSEFSGCTTSDLSPCLVSKSFVSEIPGQMENVIEYDVVEKDVVENDIDVVENDILENDVIEKDVILVI